MHSFFLRIYLEPPKGKFCIGLWKGKENRAFHTGICPLLTAVMNEEFTELCRWEEKLESF